jgi:hypothetical protein
MNASLQYVPSNREQRGPEPKPWSPTAMRLAWFAIGIGVILRLDTYLVNRSLWLDEAMVALNIANRSFAGLLRPLDFPTGAPVLYLMLLKLATVLFGINSYALRLVSLLTGIGALPLFYRVARACLSERPALVAITLFVFLSKVISYSADVKQYGDDAFVTLLILACTLKVLRLQDMRRRDIEITDLEQREERRAWLALGIVGMLSIWFAFPAIFVLAAVSGTLLWTARRGGIRNLVPPAVVSACWALCFGLDYFLFLHKTTQMTPIVSYFVKSAMPGRGALQSWYSAAYIGIFHDEVRTLFPVVAALLSVVGAAWLFRTNRTGFGLLVGPIWVVGAAALMHKYPFHDRFMFFTVPLLVLLLCAGLEPILSAQPRFLSYLAYPLALLMLAGPTAVGLVKAVRPYYFEEILPIMRYVEQRRRPGDLLYLNDLAEPAFQFYSRYDPHHPLYTMPFVQGTSEQLMLHGPLPITELFPPGATDHSIIRKCLEKLSRSPGHYRIWFLFARDTYHDEAYAVSVLDRMGKQQDHILKAGATASLYDLKVDLPDRASNTVPR